MNRPCADVLDGVAPFEEWDFYVASACPLLGEDFDPDVLVESRLFGIN